MNSKLLIGGLALFLLLPNLGCEKSAKQALPTSQREAKRGHLSSLENFSESELSAFTATYDPADAKSKEKAIGTLDKAVKLFVSPKINTKLSESAQCIIDSDDTTGRAWVSSLSIYRPRAIYAHLQCPSIPEWTGRYVGSLHQRRRDQHPVLIAHSPTLCGTLSAKPRASRTAFIDPFTTAMTWRAIQPFSLPNRRTNALPAVL